MLDPLAFVVTLGQYRFPLPGLAAAITIGLELIAGLLLLFDRHQRWALGLTGLLLTIFWGTMLLGPSDLSYCGCFGSVGPRLTYGQHIAILALMTLAWAALLRGLPLERRLLERRWDQAVALVLIACLIFLGGTTLSHRAAPVLEEILAFREIPVMTLDGRDTLLDAARTPVLFFAWWCPHCEDLIRQVARTPLPRRPVLVSTFLRSNDMDENRELTISKLRRAGLVPQDGWTVLLDKSPRWLVRYVPTLVYITEDGLRVDVVINAEYLKAAMEKAGR